MKNSSFKHFCQEKWYEHKDEILAWTGRSLTEYDDKYYFRKHRWLLKSMYQTRLIEMYAQENAKEIQKQIKRSTKKGNI